MTTRYRLVLFVTAVLLASATHVTQVAAQGEPAEYRRLVSEAVAEHDAGRFAEARALFEKANRLYPNARSMRGVGMAEFELRNYVACVLYLEQALASTVKPLDAGLRTQTEKLLAKARQYVSVVRITPDPPDASVVVDSGDVQQRPDGSVVLQVGDHMLEASAPGRVSQRRTLRIAGGEETVLHIVLANAEGAAAAVAPQVQRPEADGPIASVPPPTASVASSALAPNLTAAPLAPTDYLARFHAGMRVGAAGLGAGAQFGFDRVFRYFRLGVEGRAMKQFGDYETDDYSYSGNGPLFLDLALKPALQLALGAGRWELYLAAPVGPSVDLLYSGDWHEHTKLGLHFSIVLGATWFFAAWLGLNLEVGWQGRWLDVGVSQTGAWSKAIAPALNLVVPFLKPRGRAP